MRKYILLVSIISTVLLLVLMASTAVQAESARIVPGEQIGPVVLGMAENDVLKILGRPDKTYKTVATVNGSQRVMGKTYYYGKKRLGGHVWTINVSTIPTPQVKFIQTTSTRYATDSGIKVGSSGVDVVEAFGRQYDTNYLSGPLAGGVQLIYHNLGINFTLTRDNQVVAVQIEGSRK